MKRIVTAVILFTVALSVKAEVSKSVDFENACLASAKTGAIVARQRKNYGMTSTEILNKYASILGDMKNVDVDVKRATLTTISSIIDFVYNLKLDEKEAARLVYMKCRDGAYL